MAAAADSESLRSGSSRRSVEFLLQDDHVRFLSCVCVLDPGEPFIGGGTKKWSSKKLTNKLAHTHTLSLSLLLCVFVVVVVMCASGEAPTFREHSKIHSGSRGRHATRNGVHSVLRGPSMCTSVCVCICMCLYVSVSLSVSQSVKK